MQGYLTIIQGKAARVDHPRRLITLDDIHAVVGSPCDTFMVIKLSPRRSIDWLCNDEALLRYEDHALEIHGLVPGPLHRWALSFVRPWDGSPIAGPLMIMASNQAGESLPLTDAECEEGLAALHWIGFTREENGG